MYKIGKGGVQETLEFEDLVHNTIYNIYFSAKNMQSKEFPDYMNDGNVY